MRATLTRSLRSGFARHRFALSHYLRRRAVFFFAAFFFFAGIEVSLFR
jgi:hypothetical protein